MPSTILRSRISWRESDRNIREYLVIGERLSEIYSYPTAMTAPYVNESSSFDERPTCWRVVDTRKLLPSRFLFPRAMSLRGLTSVGKCRKVRWLPKLPQLPCVACNIVLRKQQGRERFPFTLSHARQDLEHNVRMRGHATSLVRINEKRGKKPYDSFR